MATDKNGNEIKAGDEVVVRARVKDLITLGEQTLLQVEWESGSGAFLLDYLRPQDVEIAKELNG